VIWRYLRKRLGIEAQDERITYSLKEIETLRTHITHIQKQEPKIIKQIIYKTPKNNLLLKEIEEIKNREVQVQKIMGTYKDTFLEFVDLVSEKLEGFNSRLDSFEPKLIIHNAESTRFEHLVGRSTKPLLSTTTGRPFSTTKRTTRPISTTDQIEQGQNLWECATDAERDIIKTLYDAGYPYSYHELSEKLEKSISTVKNHLNNLKSKGFQFQERIGLNNTKKYLLDARVKTFLTLRLND